MLRINTKHLLTLCATLGELHIIKLSFACLATKNVIGFCFFVAKHVHGFGVFYVQSRAFKSQKGVYGDQETTVRGSDL